MNVNASMTLVTGPVPLSLAGAPSFIETQFPVGRISAEAYKERKAGAGQTLTTLGSYWKGRKPLVLVRATVLGCLLPTTSDPVADLRVFLLLMGMDDASFRMRIKAVSPSDIDADFPGYVELIEPPVVSGGRSRWRDGLTKEERDDLIARWLSGLPYDRRLGFCLRPEEVGDRIVPPEAWIEVNRHLGTQATSMNELVEQLGVMRYGHRTVVGDTFAGGGSIPFEAARMGCDVHASDLNPIACTLTWSAFHIVGASEASRAAIRAEQMRIAEVIEREVTRLGIEHDADGNRAKAFLYCVEARCPRTGWSVPMAPSWVVSKTRGVIARLVPDHAAKRYDIRIETGASAEDVAAAELGTVRGGRLVHPMNPEPDGVSLGVVRGDHRVDGTNRNRLRAWEKSDFVPRPDDVYRERLYCIQWISKETIGKPRPNTFFATVSEADLARERTVEAIVAADLARWQAEGLVPDARIEPGDKTDEPIRTRGWTHWHHLFGARALLVLQLLRRQTSAVATTCFLDAVNFSSRLCRWETSNKRVASDGSGRQTGGASDNSKDVFSNQALNTFYNYSARSAHSLLSEYPATYPDRGRITRPVDIKTCAADAVDAHADLWITDPPYADAVNYHEITEFFIGWLRRGQPAPFDAWTWDSQRSKAIKGTDEKFRVDMVTAYRRMAARMPDDGLQVVMFTHQDAGIWADLGAIMWAAGLRVTAAWNVVTETESALKEGNHVQGTILLILRKRLADANVKRMDIEGEIEDEVDRQLAALNALDEDWISERLYTDGDLQLAAYAAALRVVTGYATIDRREVGADVYRKLVKGEKTVIRELIEYAASVANNKLVPDGFPTGTWRDLDAGSRFYVRMLDMEAKGTTRFADYQDFARTFSFAEYTSLMDSTRANAASLAGSAVLKAGMLGTRGFGSSSLRKVLFAIHKTMQREDPRDGLAYLRTETGVDYWTLRMRFVELARYVATKTARTRPEESSAADLMAQRLEVDRV